MDVNKENAENLNYYKINSVYNLSIKVYSSYINPCSFYANYYNI